MNIDRIGAVMKISRRAILADEVRPIEIEAAFDAPTKLACFQVPRDRLQRAKVVACVKVVDPPLPRTLAVIPRSILALTRRRVASDPHRRIPELRVTCHAIRSRQKRSAEAIR